MDFEIVAHAPKTPKGALIRFLTTRDRFPEGLHRREFCGEADSSVVLRHGPDREVLIGLGDAAKAGAENIRRAAATAVRLLQGAAIDSAALDLTAFPAHVENAVEGAITGAYQFEPFLPDDRRIPRRFSKLTVAVGAPHVARAKGSLAAGIVRGESVNYARSLADLPGNYVVPETLAEAALALAKQRRRLRVAVLREQRLVREGFGGLVAVGGGSANPPRLIVIEYRGAPASKRPVALVGKAITFDSGGISIKPAERMDEMKYDKAGGCAVLGIMDGAARLGLKRNLVGIVAAAENMPGSESYRPGDILTAYDGKTIEVMNTDAEGRLVLADALAFARMRYQPEAILDFATLTGAAVVALGVHRAALFSNDRTLAEALRRAADTTGDAVWEMPHDEPYHKQIKSDVALVKNTGGKEAGACTGAAFLEKWVPDVPWAHLDIAGPAWTTREQPHAAKGATGFGVRLALEYLARSA